jgi:hypothetical protein
MSQKSGVRNQKTTTLLVIGRRLRFSIGPQTDCCKKTAITIANRGVPPTTRSPHEKLTAIRRMGIQRSRSQMRASAGILIHGCAEVGNETNETTV